MNIIASRLPALKFIGIAGGIQLALTLFSNSTGMPMLSVGEYVESDISSNSPFIITGVLKPRSVKISRGLQKRFQITDNTYDVTCVYNGTSKNQFREGQLLVMQSYCPDIAKKNHIVVKEYLTKHSMEASQWEKKSGVDKKAYGLQNTYN